MQQQQTIPRLWFTNERIPIRLCLTLKVCRSFGEARHSSAPPKAPKRQIYLSCAVSVTIKTKKEITLTQIDNCRDYDYRSQLSGTKQSTEVPGICDNVASFLLGRGLAPDTGIKLTWDPTHADPRRDFLCPTRSGGKGFCNQEEQNLIERVGLPPGTKRVVSCNEFPFASSEEGGNFFAEIADSKTSPGVKYVPVWQQTLQGMCNGKGFLTIYQRTGALLTIRRNFEQAVHKFNFL